jgi:predicted transcriptional regulator
MNTPPPEGKLTIRLHAQIATAMRKLAQEHDRSLNGEIVRALRAYITVQRKRREREREWEQEA